MYYFLSASLPDLQFGKTPGLSVAEFDELCARELTPEALRDLKNGGLGVSREPGAADELPGVYAEYTRFEQYLRTRIAERRTGRDEERSVHLPDPQKYFTEVDTALGAAAASSDPLEREKSIDRIRWRMLDDLEAGHEFDFTHLCVYRLRLAILEKYANRNAEKGRRDFNAAVDRVVQAAEAAHESK